MKSVYLSPSTQEKNIGVNGYKSEEYRMNQVADIVESILKGHGVKVYRNRPNMTLKQVVNDSNLKKPDVHVAIHSNAYNRVSRGCEAFCYRKNSIEGYNLAKEIYYNVAKITPTSDRGVKEGCNFYGAGKHMYEVAYTHAAAALVEVAFHDNLADSNWIKANIEPLGIAIAIGTLSYLGINYKEKKETESKVKFPVTEEAKNIIKKYSKYHEEWISFFLKNQHINLSGLVKMFEDKITDLESNYEALKKHHNLKSDVKNETFDLMAKKVKELNDIIQKVRENQNNILK